MMKTSAAEERPMIDRPRLQLRLSLAVLATAFALPACSRNDKNVALAPSAITEDEAVELASEASDSAAPSPPSFALRTLRATLNW